MEPVIIQQFLMEKGSNTMRIAVTYENGEIFQHFGHTAQFKLYDVEDGKIVQEQVVDTNGSGHGALAGFLQAAGADCLICGGIGMGAQMALADAGVKLYGGVQGAPRTRRPMPWRRGSWITIPTPAATTTTTITARATNAATTTEKPLTAATRRAMRVASATMARATTAANTAATEAWNRRIKLFR